MNRHAYVVRVPPFWLVGGQVWPDGFTIPAIVCKTVELTTDLTVVLAEKLKVCGRPRG